jgi:hypothetical protein
VVSQAFSHSLDPLLPFEIRQAMTAMQGSPFVVPDAENFSIAHDGFAPIG